MGIIAKENSCPFYPEINDFIELKEGLTILLNGQENKTFWEFKENQTAFSKINFLCKNLIGLIQQKNNFDILSMDNWFDYSMCLDEIDYFDVSSVSMLKSFFNVCDNVERNAKAKSLANEKIINEEEMAMLLPYFSPYSTEYYSKPKVVPRASFNVAAAVNYATEWA